MDDLGVGMSQCHQPLDKPPMFDIFDGWNVSVPPKKMVIISYRNVVILDQVSCHNSCNAGIAIMNHPCLMVGIPPMNMVMNGGWFMALQH